MTRDKSRRDLLRPEDRVLWESVAKTTTPLVPHKALLNVDVPDFTELMGEHTNKKSVRKAAVIVSNTSPKKSAPSLSELPIHNFDKPTHRKIAKGRVDIEARIDLHGLTQREAYGLLYEFLLNAHARGLRLVLVITGKGRSFGSEGVLRQAVPHWFSTPLFRLLVSAYEDAARHHGGHGALYIRMRRRTPFGD